MSLLVSKLPMGNLNKPMHHTELDLTNQMNQAYAVEQ